MTGSAIEELGRLQSSSDSVSVDHLILFPDLMYGNKVLLSLRIRTLLWRAFRDSLANERRQNVVDNCNEMKAETTGFK